MKDAFIIKFIFILKIYSLIINTAFAKATVRNTTL